MRTLVISDLHLGSRLGRDVLRRPEPLAALVAALEDVDRLVLLGDTVELLEGRPRVAMELAGPVLQEIGRAMRGQEVVVVAGNHDHAMVRRWLRDREAMGMHVGLATRVGRSGHGALERIAALLRPARVRFQYPGVWLADGVWAHHGHYLDRHLVPETKAGGRLVGGIPQSGANAYAYEHATGASLAAMQGAMALTLPKAIGDPLDAIAGLTRWIGGVALPVAAALGTRGMLAPLSAGVLGFQFRRAGLPAMGTVADRLGVPAHHVVFGHLHRLGPSPTDPLEEWRPFDRHQLLNTGCWVYEPLLLAGAEPPHPYWPGGAVVVEDGAPPRAINLLGDVPERALR